MKKFFYCLVFLFILISRVQAQDSHVKDKLRVNISYNSYPWLGDMSYYYSFDKFKTFTPAGIIESNYLLLRYLEVGAYLGFSMYERVDYEELEAAIENETDFPIFLEKTLKPVFLYGANVNLQLLPLILKRDILFLDTYLSAKLGGFYFVDKTKSYLAHKHSRFDYGIYAGLALYPAKHWGIYGEYGRGNFVDWRAGLSFRF